MNHPAGSDAGSRRPRGDTVTAAQTHDPTSRSVAVALCDEQQLLTADEVADRIGMTPAWVYSETRAARIPHVRLGRYVRYRAASIESWLEAIEQGTVT
jgi:excisionase family DNA binding protein